jgi:hypothetical protein
VGTEAGRFCCKKYLDQISLDQREIVSTRPLVVPSFGLLDCAAFALPLFIGPL